MKSLIRDILITILIAVVIFFGLQATIQSFIVDGPSMEPNFHNGQRVIANKLIYRFQDPQRGEVIIFRSPNQRQGDLIKRVIALPGEYVTIEEGVVYIHEPDGEVIRLDEPYIDSLPRTDFVGTVVPPDTYFVLGDNRNNSDDSRRGWVVPRQNIIGKAWLSTWPPGQWGLVANPFADTVAGAR
jgi:signal peptidase I